MSIKYFTWYMKSRNKVDTIKGVDEHGDFKSKQWEDKMETLAITFGILKQNTQELQLTIL